MNDILEGQTGTLPCEVHNDIEETAMLRATTFKIADNIIVRCQGGIVVGEDLAALRRTVTKDCSAKLVVLARFLSAGEILETRAKNPPRGRQDGLTDSRPSRHPRACLSQ